MDWTARLWDTASGQPRGEPMRHRARVTQVAFTPDGRMLASNSVDGLIRIWDVETQQLHAFPLRNPEVDPGSGSGNNLDRLSFSPDGSMLAGAFGISGSRDATRVWRAGPATQIQTFEHSSGVLAVDLSPDGNRLATATRFEVKIRATGTGRVLIYPVRNPRRPWVAFSPDGTLLAIIESDHGVRLLHSATGQPIGPPLPRGKGLWLSGLAFSPDGKRLAITGPSGTSPGAMIRVWDTATQELLAEIPGNSSCLAFSPDGRQLAAGYEDWRVSLWDLTGEPKIARSMATGERCSAVAYSPDSKRLATGSLGGLVQLWDPATGMPPGPAYHVGGKVRSIDFSPDGTLLAIGAEGQPARVWDLTLGPPYAAVALPATHAAVAVAFGGNGRMLAIGSPHGAAHLLHLAEPPNTTRELQLRTLIGTGVRVSQGGLASIPAEEWQSLRAELRALRAGEEEPLSVIAHRGGPRYGQALLHLRLAHRQREGGKWEEAAAAFRDAIALLEVLVAGEPTSSEYRHDLAVASGELGSIHAERSEWDRAVSHLARAMALRTEADPRPSFDILRSYAVACLGAGQLDEYQATCGQMLEQLGRPDDDVTTNNLAWTCVLAPDAVADPARVVSLAEAAVAARPGERACLGTLGAVLYRAGRYSDAVRRLEESMAAEGRGGTPFDWLFLAMAHHRLGHAEEARSWLDRSVRGIEQSADSRDVMDTLAWGDRLALGLLRGEAEALLMDADFPADPFEPSR
nr:tetratricopeptide repeat protein [Planctomyces sp. SH-PL62]